MTDRAGQQLGNYRLIRLLGEGGFAEVYLGEHIHLSTQAAIKVLHTQLTSDDMDKFRTEARTIARLIHPHIVRVLEFGIEGKTPFLVMDYAPNGTLRQRHPRGAVLPLPLIVAYIKQVADALQYAHDEKIIHRDIKPENMLLGRRNDILLSDFGIALVAQSSRYQSAQEMAGTMAYMAPEQIQGKPRPASDQYSLGVVAYEWLSGDRPFHGSLTELVGQHLSVPPPSLQAKFSTISPGVEQAVLTALAKDPKQRFASVQTFAAALEQAYQSWQRYSSASPVLASPPSQSPLPNVIAPSPSQSSQPIDVVTPSISLSQPTAAATRTRTPAVSPLSTEKTIPSGWPQASRQRITRRTVLVGLAGLATVAGAGGSIALLTHRQPSQNLPAALPTPASTSSTTTGTMFGYDLQRTHFNPDEHTLSPTTVSRLVPYWTASTGDQIRYSSPAVAGGVVYVGSQDHKLYAFHAATGSILWTASTGGPIGDSSPAVAGDVVYVGSEDNKFYAFHAATGSILWAASTGGPINSSPAVANGVVYVGSQDHKLYAFHTATGDILWTASTGDQIRSSPTVANGVVYVGSQDHKLYAFHLPA